ncbi:GTPase Der [Streptomyces violarus]
MNDQTQPDGSDAYEGAPEHDHGALGDAEYAEFMELAVEEGFDLEDVEGAIEEAGHGPLPVLTVVGRPNVGKSTLVNRIIGRREAVVEDKPGVTRDRVTYEAEWAGRRFKVVDTGGWEQDILGIDASVAAQAEYAIEAADTVVFVVDAKVGATDTDEAVVRLLRKAGKPVVLCANKVDGPTARPTRPPVVAGPGGAVPGLRAARPGHRRHARPGPGGAAGGAARDVRRGRHRRASPHRPDRPPERRQVLAAEQGGGRRCPVRSGGSSRPRRWPLWLMPWHGHPAISVCRSGNCSAVSR